MAKDKRTKAELLIALERSEAQRIALHAFELATWKDAKPDLEISYPMICDAWTARVFAPSKAHGGVCIVLNAQGAVVHDAVLLDDLASHWLKQRMDSYLGEFARTLIRERDAFLKGGPRTPG